MTTSIRDGESEVAVMLERVDPIDGDRFAIIYRHYKPSLVRSARRLGARDPEGVADLALLDGYKIIDHLRNRSEPAFGYYLLQAVRSHSIAEYRRKDPAEVGEIDEDALVLEDPADNLVDAAWLRQLVLDLPPDQRDVIESRYFLDLSGQDTASRLEKSPNAVYQLQHRALHRLRRAIFAGVFAALVVLAAVAARQALTSPSDVDSTPAEVPDTPVETSVVDRETPNRSVTDNNVESPDPDDQPIGPSGEQVSSIEAGEADAVQTEADTGEQEDVPVPTTRPAIEAPPAEPALEQETEEEPPVVTTPPTTAAATIEPRPAATGTNVCAPHQITLDLSAFKLYFTNNRSSVASAFVAPEAVRFLDRGGAALHEIDASGPMVTGDAPNSHGWIGAGDGSGTYAVFEEAPLYTYWGVLAGAADTAGWTSIEVLDPATNTWLPVEGCP